jgi:hypothetical protein
VAGPLADPLARDLLSDRLTLDQLGGWRDLWAYVTAAPPGTAIHYAACDGWPIGDRLAAELLTDVRRWAWKYTARNFEGGRDAPWPDPILYPGSAAAAQTPVLRWETATLDDLMTPQVRELMKG